jgi:hypothetical protein
VAGAQDNPPRNLIVLVPILLNSHPGTKYGIRSVFARGMRTAGSTCRR